MSDDSFDPCASVSGQAIIADPAAPTYSQLRRQNAALRAALDAANADVATLRQQLDDERAAHAVACGERDQRNAQIAAMAKELESFALEEWTQPGISGDKITRRSCGICGAKCEPDEALQHKPTCPLSSLPATAQRLMRVVEAAEALDDTHHEVRAAAMLHMPMIFLQKWNDLADALTALKGEDRG